MTLRLIDLMRGFEAIHGVDGAVLVSRYMRPMKPLPAEWFEDAEDITYEMYVPDHIILGAVYFN